jgi:hypothetical protein
VLHEVMLAGTWLLCNTLNVNVVYAGELWRSITCLSLPKEECLARFILFGEAALHHALREYMAHYHHERNHQGKGNVLLLPAISHDAEHAGYVQCRERLGGLLKYYEREAA